MTDTRRGGRERGGAGAQGRAGTRLKVEGDVVMADADENPKQRAQGQRQGGKGRWGGGVRGCRRVRREQLGSGTRDVSLVRGAVWGITRSIRDAVSEHRTVTEQSARS